MRKKKKMRGLSRLLGIQEGEDERENTAGRASVWRTSLRSLPNPFPRVGARICFFRRLLLTSRMLIVILLSIQTGMRLCLLTEREVSASLRDAQLSLCASLVDFQTSSFSCGASALSVLVFLSSSLHKKNLRPYCLPLRDFLLRRTCYVCKRVFALCRRLCSLYVYLGEQGSNRESRRDGEVEEKEEEDARRLYEYSHMYVYVYIYREREVLVLSGCVYT